MPFTCLHAYTAPTRELWPAYVSINRDDRSGELSVTVRSHGDGGRSVGMIVLTEELARAGSGGLIASLMSHGIATPPIGHTGTPAYVRAPCASSGTVRKSAFSDISVCVMRMNSDTHFSTPPTRVRMSRNTKSRSPSMGAR